jgi:hypothetical protein
MISLFEKFEGNQKTIGVSPEAFLLVQLPPRLFSSKSVLACHILACQRHMREKKSRKYLLYLQRIPFLRAVVGNKSGWRDSGVMAIHRQMGLIGALIMLH